MGKTLKVLSPVDGRVYVERPLATGEEIDKIMETSASIQRYWKRLPLEHRVSLLHRFVDAMVARRTQLAEELTWQMGRPIAHSPGEVDGFEERARHMLDIAEPSLADIQVPEKPGFVRYIQREALGVVLVVAPWNYPMLTAVNAVVPALAAGNTVVLKHSAQTPLVAERFEEAGRDAGLPPGVLQHIHMSHEGVARAIAHPVTAHVAFTGSVEGGRDVHRAAADKFIACGLELGGKDPAYVRPDAPMKHTIEMLVDGAFFNAGQSCCGIERIYVHKDVYDTFLDGFVALTNAYKLGDPTDPDTTLGPVVRLSAAEFIRGQVQEAVSQGARALIDPSRFPEARPGTPYLAPQVLVDVDHSMRVMTEETFGPVVGIMKVESDEQAIELMNDSPYGLTAVVATMDMEEAQAIGLRIETGTIFMNRCDYLDPALAWVGVKDTGRGCTLSRVGYEHLTRPKSFHLRVSPL